jgi:hypothetical protein
MRVFFFRQTQWIAKVYALLVDPREDVLTWLQGRVTANSIGGFYIDQPFGVSVRDDSRLTDLLRQMGIP